MNTRIEFQGVDEQGSLRAVEGQELLGVTGGVMADLDENGNIVRTCTDPRPPYPAISTFKRRLFSF